MRYLVWVMSGRGSCGVGRKMTHQECYSRGILENTMSTEKWFCLWTTKPIHIVFTLWS